MLTVILSDYILEFNQIELPFTGLNNNVSIHFTNFIQYTAQREAFWDVCLKKRLATNVATFY